ncbi:hypothetical protein GCM10023108_16900 [Saccharopolyspora hordei]
MVAMSWSVHVRWAPWSRVLRLRLAGDRWPRLSEGPVSVALRLAWFPLLGVVLLGCWLELLLVLALMPFVLLVRALEGSWRVEVSAHGCRVGVVRVSSFAAARRVRRALREHLERRGGLDGVAELLAEERAELTPVAVSPRRWRLVEKRLSPYGRRRWFLWRRRMSFEAALDSLPSGVGDDPISAIIVVPFLLWSAVLSAGATLELAAQLVLLPFVVLLRLCRVLPWPVELVRRDSVEPSAMVPAWSASVRARRELTAAHAVRLPVPDLRPAQATAALARPQPRSC